MLTVLQLILLCHLGAVFPAVALSEGVAAAVEPAEFQFNPRGGDPVQGGTNSSIWSKYVESPRFRIFYKPTQNGVEGRAKTALKHLEAAYECYTGVLGWRSSGLSYNGNQESGPYYKLNGFAITSGSEIGGAAGVMGSDRSTGHAFLYVMNTVIDNPGTTVHEYGHAMTYYERNWVDQGNTGTWWEPTAEFFSDTYMTSPFCEPARKKYGFNNAISSKLRWEPVINNAHLVLVDGTPGKGNYYQSWPFLAYLTYNPDNIKGLGKFAVRDMIRAFKKPSRETPLHGLAKMIAPISINEVVTKYWARVAVGEIGHPNSRSRFESARRGLNFAALDKAGEDFTIKGARAPKYMGAGIHPIKGNGKVSVQVTSDAPLSAMISIRAKSGAVKLVDLPKGAGEAEVEAGDEAALVVVNTPESLVIYNGFEIAKSAAAKTLSYKVKIAGASFVAKLQCYVIRKYATKRN